MGILGIIGKVAGSKIIGKVEDELTKKQNREQTSQYCIYMKTNIASIRKLLEELEGETKNLVSQIKSTKGIRISFRGKSELRKVKDRATECLRYLYLSKDFFICLSKNASGVALRNEELMLVIKFSPYFDGVPVLKLSEEDDSLLGQLNEVREEFRAIFVSSKKSASYFNFEEYLERHKEKIEEYTIPDVMGAISSFENAMALLEVQSSATENTNVVSTSATTGTEHVECTVCHAKLSATAKFCPECGNKIESKKPSFCIKCGASLASGANFCGECGTKV
jgi:ribosomal protein L40E